MGNKGQETIIISRTDKIGDFVVSIPSYATARVMFPQAKIVALVSKHNKILAQGLKCVDEVVSIDDYESQDDLVSKLRSLHPDAFVALVSNNNISRLAVRSGAKRRIGPLSRFWSFFHYNQGLRQSRSRCLKSEAAYNLDLIRHLDPKRYDSLAHPCFERIAFSEADAQVVANYLAQENLSATPFILVNPFTGGSGANLNCEQYGQVIASIVTTPHDPTKPLPKRNRRALATLAPDSVPNSLMESLSSTGSDSTAIAGSTTIAGSTAAIAGRTGDVASASTSAITSADAAAGASSANTASDSLSVTMDAASALDASSHKFIYPEVVILAMPCHKEKVELILAQIPAHARALVHCFFNEGSLLVAAALVDRCKVFIGPSTGITQIAGNYQKRTLCFYSSRISNSHRRWELFGDEDEVPFTFDVAKLDYKTRELTELSPDMGQSIITTALEELWQL